MSVVLIVDTSNSFSLSLFGDDGLLSHFDDSDCLCSKLMVFYLNRILCSVGVSVSDIDYVGVSLGPGSYTGVRVGCSFSVGLCQALGRKMIAFNILESVYSYLQNIYIGSVVCPVISANNNNLFTIMDGVVTKISIFEFRKLLMSVRNSLVVLLDNVFDEYFFNNGIRSVRISNIQEIMYYFVCRSIVEKKFCDIRNYRVDYFD